VHHALAVGHRQGQPHLVEEPGRVRRGHGAAREDLPEVPALEVPHHQVGAVRLPPEVVEGDDVGVLEPGYQLGLRLEAADELRIVGESGVDDLHRHLPAHLGLERPVDRPEGSLPERLQQPVAAERPPGELRQGPSILHP